MLTREAIRMIERAGGVLERVGTHRRYRIGKHLFSLGHGSRQDGRVLPHLKSVLRKVKKEKECQVS